MRVKSAFGTDITYVDGSTDRVIYYLIQYHQHIKLAGD